MKLNRTPNPLDRAARNSENDNWDIIEGEIRTIGDKVDDFVEEISDEAFNKIVDSARLDWDKMVDTYDDLPTNAKEGATIGVKADSKVYRYDGSNWIDIYEINLNPISEGDERLTTQLAQKANKDDYVFICSLAPFPSMKNIENENIGNGPRMIECFDQKIWGYKGSTGEIFYSKDEGKTWTLMTDSWQTSWGWISRLIPTNDGEVMALCQTELRKSIGWGTDNVTWSSNKV